jgi:hypothetical protein
MMNTKEEGEGEKREGLRERGSKVMIYLTLDINESPQQNHVIMILVESIEEDKL